jgi:hypothetical protein
MTNWYAWSRHANDAELAELVASRDVGSPRWCFVESPTCSDFLDATQLERHIGGAWMVRLFAKAGELAARRRDFGSEQPWLVRVISEQPPAGAVWRRHSLDGAERQSLVLYGTHDAEGRFIEGTQFRDAFDYPGVEVESGSERAVLVTCVHRAGDGGPVVRWVALRMLGKNSSKGRTP